jgi:hypothetical protein
MLICDLFSVLTAQSLNVDNVEREIVFPSPELIAMRSTRNDSGMITSISERLDEGTNEVLIGRLEGHTSLVFVLIVILTNDIDCIDYAIR